ncbi:hypothetical protein [Streptomyces sp. ISL-94]|uniref:hypothetical protein n=1 Tax=Streptomyces sp. ISL-94 TaxID=2819190 RepID=UPI001BE92685|nr:hypothetical protein [Streptomyces sp. ISL-94]MBT2482966.1 hypothetical protein [Streptomyces sp. ISL-94]
MFEAASPVYRITNAYEWTERAFRLLEAEQLTVTEHGAPAAAGFVVSGPCPRCEHHIVDRRAFVALTGMGGGGRDGGTDATEAVVLDVSCGCGTAHQDAPEGVTGCGASFRIELTAG